MKFEILDKEGNWTIVYKYEKENIKEFIEWLENNPDIVLWF